MRLEAADAATLKTAGELVEKADTSLEPISKDSTALLSVQQRETIEATLVSNLRSTAKYMQSPEVIAQALLQHQRDSHRRLIAEKSPAKATFELYEILGTNGAISLRPVSLP